MFADEPQPQASPEPYKQVSGEHLSDESEVLHLFVLYTLRCHHQVDAVSQAHCSVCLPWPHFVGPRRWT